MPARVAIAVIAFAAAFLGATTALAFGAWQLAVFLVLVGQLPLLATMRPAPARNPAPPPLWRPAATCRPRRRGPLQVSPCRPAIQMSTTFGS